MSHIERDPPCRGARGAWAGCRYSKHLKRKSKVFEEKCARARRKEKEIFCGKFSPLFRAPGGVVCELQRGGCTAHPVATARRQPAKVEIRVVVSGFSVFFRRSFHLDALSNNLGAYAETFSPIRVWSLAPCSEFCNLSLTSQATEPHNYRNTLPFLHQTLTQCSSSSGTIES